MHDIDQLLSAFRSVTIMLACRIDDVEANVILHNLRHEAIDRAAHRRNQMKNVSAADFLLKRTLNGFDLPTDATHTFQELGLLAEPPEGDWTFLLAPHSTAVTQLLSKDRPLCPFIFSALIIRSCQSAVPATWRC
jgi:hypothetical protein